MQCPGSPHDTSRAVSNEDESHLTYTEMRNHSLIIAAIRPFSIEDQSSRLIYTKSNKPEKRHRMHKVISEQGLSLNQIRSTVGSSQLHKQRFKVSKCSNETFAVSGSQDLYGYGGRLSLSSPDSGVTYSVTASNLNETLLVSRVFDPG